MNAFNETAQLERCLNISENASMQLLDISDNFLKISVPFRMMVAGPTLVGKSQFMLKAVRHRDQLFKGKFERIIYCLPSGSVPQHYNYVKDLKEAFENLEVVEGLPDPDDLNLLDQSVNKLVIIDDLIQELLDSQVLYDVFTKNSHHANISLSKSKTQYFVFRTKYSVFNIFFHFQFSPHKIHSCPRALARHLRAIAVRWFYFLTRQIKLFYRS